MEESMSRAAGFRGVPTPQKIPRLCGSCHSDIEKMRAFRPRIQTDQEKQYYTSVHGKKLKSGDTKVATCVSCHGVHQIFPVKDTRSKIYPTRVPETCNSCHGDSEYMKPYKIPTDQYEKYTNSVHGRDLLEKGDIGAPACNDCHGNHGATPPGVASISHVCGNCHVNNMDYFEKSPMAAAFSEMELHACESCHGYHEIQPTSIEMIGLGNKGVCKKCHEAGDNGAAIAQTLYTLLKNLEVAHDSVEIVLQEVNRKGMDDEEILVLKQKTWQSFIHSRTLVHTFDTTQVGKTAREGLALAKTALTLEYAQLKEYATRTKGLGISIVIIFILAAALYLKSKEMEKKEHN
ncbi:MAG: hypothetical protein Kow0037_31710 [Calditrichia bacterium]